jgi:hypothetical protein
MSEFAIIVNLPKMIEKYSLPQCMHPVHIYPKVFQGCGKPVDSFFIKPEKYLITMLCNK